MFTVCPKCALTLVVTAADLRVAQGYVRCGRCSSVFNALAQLSDERQAAGSGTAAAAPPAPQTAPSPTAPPDTRTERPPPPRTAREPPQPPRGDEDSIPEDALEFDASRTDVNAVFVEPAPDPQWTAATGSFKALRALSQETPATPDAAAPAARAEGAVDVEIDSDLLAGIVEGETPRPASGEAAPPASAGAAAAGASGPRGPVAARGGTPAPPPPAPPPAAAQSARPARDARADEAAADAAAEDMLPPPRPLDRWLARLGTRQSARWASGAALLVIALAAQLVNHSRDALATHARLNRPLTALYAALGVPLVPHWDLRAYDVRQLGASVDPGGGEITVRASIRNAGAQPQPLPLLRVTLQDRFGTPLASRDVSPRDYLPGAVPPGSFLSVDQRIDAEMAFVDPGASAVGFEIDACLQSEGGTVACANDPGK
jgi:predicted Zn finger-like uncharacterized protein